MAGLKEFFEKLASDTDLQEKVKTAGDENTLLKVIKDAGYDIKPEELRKITEEAAMEGELSDDDLDNVSGGEMNKLLTLKAAEAYYKSQLSYAKMIMRSQAESIDWDLLDACGVPYLDILGAETLKQLGVWRDEWGAV